MEEPEKFSRAAWRKAEVADKILDFLKKNGECTWTKLLELTGLSRATLFKYLPMLIKEGYVKGEARVPENQIEHVYFLADPEKRLYSFHEKDPTEEIRIHIPDEPPKDGSYKAYAESGVMRRSPKVKGKMVFHRTGPKPPLANTKPKKQLLGVQK
jgi:predicted transcriptional regulator